MAIPATARASDEALLDAARGGDEEAFRRLAEQYRGELLAHCYRMLGSTQDAEDAFQDSLLRMWRGLPGFGSRSTLRTWLYRIATNVCLDAIARRPSRMLPLDYGPPSSDEVGGDPGTPPVESVWVEPYPDEAFALPQGYATPDARYEQREAVELAFIVALQQLPATQRAVLLMRDVLGFSAREVSVALGTTVASVNSALQRARKSVDERRPEQSQQATLRALGDKRIRELVEAYVDAWRRGDVGALRELLAQDAVFSMPPWPSWWRGPDTIAGFAQEAVKVCAESRCVPVRANGQLALAYYLRNDATGRHEPAAIDVLTLDGSRIKEITAFITPEVFPRFGLPAEPPPQSS